jgi:O-antigen ligase
MEIVTPSSRSSASAPLRRATTGRRAALGIFLLLIVVAPLAFGAVDRISQIALLGLLGVGMLAHPPAMRPLSRWGNRLAIALIVVVLVKEFAPAAWFGTTPWRLTLAQDHGLGLPWTHNPEPARALDGLLGAVVAGIWFLWVRTLAADRDHRLVIAWSLLLTAVLVTAVSFATRGLDPQAIYGWRFTPGWTGFGPFPNRNHTANFLAMGMVLGLGCVTWAGARKRWFAAVGGSLLVAFTAVGLFATQSRGGLLAACFGTAVFIALALLKSRDRRAVAVASGGVLGLGALGLVFGLPVLARFTSADSGTVSNVMRLTIWKDAIEMWKDAPLFGHGIGTFAQLIGLYQNLQLEDRIVLHPESSWLQWLTEMGAVSVGLAMAAFAWFSWRQIRDAFEHEGGFFLRIGGFAAAAVLLFHALIDVPGHRWATVAFALAALALACPLSRRGMRTAPAPRAAWMPLAIAAFWTLPFVFNWPPWSPLALQRLITRENTRGGVQLAEVEEALRYFPLQPELHQSIGLRQVGILGRSAPAVWQRHFSIASTLVPGWWSLTAAQARAVAPITPGLALGYWQEAIARGDLHREDVLRTAVRETSRFPSVAASWGRYIEANPDLCLAYAPLVTDAAARHFYGIWWKERALTAELRQAEIDAFYSNASRWGTRAQFDQWMKHRAAWRERDFRQWATLLHEWKDDVAAFQLLAHFMSEPEFPKAKPSMPREQLETRWRISPTNVVNARDLASARHRDGETLQSDQIIVTVAAQEGAPPWFLRKAAHIYARDGRHSEAVAILLRSR